MLAEPAPRPTFGWKLLNSWWILISILGFGCFSGAGFLLIGLRARKLWWSVSGLAYLLIGSALFVFASRLGTEESANGPLAVLWFVVWFVSVVHSFVLNVFWLRWQEAHRPAAGLPYGPPSPWNTSTAFPSTSTTPWQSQPAWSPAPVFGPLDVNTATAVQLATLTGFDPGRMTYALAERDRRGGFSSVEEFAMVAQLTAHQFALARSRLTCTPRY